jgi:dephospho-CoA kinase
MKLIGLTGGIACGKSTAADVLRQLGVHVIDADKVSRTVVAPGSVGLKLVSERFGPGILGEDGDLDREALGVAVMADVQAKEDLEAITHPLIQEAISQLIQERAMAGDPALVVEAALLVETGSWRLYDQLWVIRASRQTQIERLCDRKQCTAEVAARWVDSQLPVDEKVRYAHIVIDNDGTRQSLVAQIQAAWTSFIGQPPA